MRNLKFHSMRAYNFICFGPQGIEINFDKLGNIIHVKGENRDFKEEDSGSIKSSSNGSGKSSCLSCLIYGLYGKTVNKPSAIGVNGVIHNLINKDCRVEVEWDNYKLIRTRSSKNTLRLWESKDHVWDDSTEITTGSIVETQKKIEEILGLSYEAFINISVFTDDQSICFLESTGPVKREIVENLLSLGIYRERQEKINALIKETKSNISVLGKEFDLLQNSKIESEKRLNQTIQKENNWKIIKNQECNNLLSQIESKKKALNNTDHGKEILIYQQAQERIQEVQKEISNLEPQQETINSQIKIGKQKEETLKEQTNKIKEENFKLFTESSVLEKTVNLIEKHIQSLKKNEHGTTCEHCLGIIDKNNFLQVIEKEQQELKVLNKNLSEYQLKLYDFKQQIENNLSNINKIKELITPKEKTYVNNELNLKKLRNELIEKSKVREPKGDSSELLLQQELEQLNKSLKAKKEELEGISPYEEIIDNDKKELEKAIELYQNKESQVKDLEKKLPYYQYWNIGFGEKGIRKYVIDGIIPQLNNRISYWLQFLIDNKIILTFDNELNENIVRNPPDGNPYIYHALSAGQRRRLNLAVSQAFADIMMLSTGTIPSVIFLDEVTTNIDRQGVSAVYEVIQELSQDKQVFVTTHDQDMMKLLENHDSINLIYEKGFTTIQ